MSGDRQSQCSSVASEAISAGYFPNDGASINYGMFSRSYSRAHSLSPLNASIAQRSTIRDPSTAAVIAGSIKYQKSKRSLKDRTATTGQGKTFTQLFSSRFSTAPGTRCGHAQVFSSVSRSEPHHSRFVRSSFLDFHCHSQGAGTTPAAPLRWDLHSGEQPVHYPGGLALRDCQPSHT